MIVAPRNESNGTGGADDFVGNEASILNGLVREPVHGTADEQAAGRELRRGTQVKNIWVPYGEQVHLRVARGDRQ